MVGVAILIAISLNVIVNQCWKEHAENAIIMDITLDDCKLTLGSVYVWSKYHGSEVL